MPSPSPAHGTDAAALKAAYTASAVPAPAAPSPAPFIPLVVQYGAKGSPPPTIIEIDAKQHVTFNWPALCKADKELPAPDGSPQHPSDMLYAVVHISVAAHGGCPVERPPVPHPWVLLFGIGLMLFGAMCILASRLASRTSYR